MIMTAEENKAVVRRLFQEVFNEKRLDRADEFVAPGYIDHGAVPGQAPGLEGAKQQRWAMYFAAIPDMHATIDDMVAEGDKVTVRYTVRGTHQGQLLNIPPTGKRFQMEAISIYRLADWKIVEQWEKSDTLELMRQLGAMPPPAQHANA
jgi:predicted ester cyclase